MHNLNFEEDLRRGSQSRKVKSERCAATRQEDLAASVRIGRASCFTLKASVLTVLLVEWNYTVLLLIASHPHLQSPYVLRFHTNASNLVSFSTDTKIFLCFIIWTVDDNFSYRGSERFSTDMVH